MHIYHPYIIFSWIKHKEETGTKVLKKLRSSLHGEFDSVGLRACAGRKPTMSETSGSKSKCRNNHESSKVRVTHGRIESVHRMLWEGFDLELPELAESVIINLDQYFVRNSRHSMPYGLRLFCFYDSTVNVFTCNK